MPHFEWVDNADMMVDTADYDPLNGDILEMYLGKNTEDSFSRDWFKGKL